MYIYIYICMHTPIQILYFGLFGLFGSPGLGNKTASEASSRCGCSVPLGSVPVHDSACRSFVGFKALCLLDSPEGPSIQYLKGLGSQMPLRVWVLEPEASNTGYLDPLG